MKRALIIGGREFRMFLTTPSAYVIISAFVAMSGLFFFGLLREFNSILRRAAILHDVTPSLNQSVITPLLYTLGVLLLFIVPLLTMRAFPEERKNGTFELLASSTLGDAEIVVGKFIGAAMITILLILLSAVFPLILALNADPEPAPIAVGVVGLLFYGVALTAIGVGFSAFCRSQLAAALGALVFSTVLFVTYLFSSNVPFPWSEFIGGLSPANHLLGPIRGVLGAADLVYFLSLTVAGLFGAWLSFKLERRQ